MKFLRGIDKFKSYQTEVKNIVGNYIINDGAYQAILEKLKTYEAVLGIKNDNLSDNNEMDTVKSVLLSYLDYLDYYIMSHFLSNVYDVQFNPLEAIEVDQDIDLVIDFVTLLYKQRYPNDDEIDKVKYNELRKEFQAMYGTI